MPNHGYVYLVGAILLNLVALWCLEPSKGLTRLWPSVFLIGAIVVTQVLIAMALRQGIDLGPGMMILLVLMMIASAVFGYLQNGVIPTTGQYVGYAVAVIGVLIVNFAKKLGF